MSDRTGIEWTNKTYNPWYGCTKVSPGCAHCYMFRDMKRYGRDPETVTRSKTTFWAPLRWTEPALVFTCSWSDFFHEGADAWRPDVWQIIRDTPHLTYQILTKRPERMRDHLPPDWGEGYRNVWLGVSIENQRHRVRSAILADTPTALRFISAEPLLGPLDLGLDVMAPLDIAWVIVGGESGPDCRPMELDWARTIRDDCAAEGVPFFLKQLGGWPDKRGGEKAILDGRRHVEMPQAAAV